MAWIYLCIAGVLEILWAISLKHSDGFSNLRWSLWTVVGMITSFYFLAQSLKTIPVGTAYADYAQLDDPVIDVAITPNRQDCMGVRGIARDLAAAGLGKLKPLVVPSVDGSFPCPTEIRTDDPAGCPAFFGRVIKGVKNGPSPDWMQARLKAAGRHHQLCHARSWPPEPRL